CTRPRRILTDTSSSAATLPNRLVTPTTSISIARMVRYRSIERGDQRAARAHRAEYAALHLDHLEGGQMIAVVGRAAAILEQHAFEAAIVRLAHGGVDANVGGDAGENEVADLPRPQDELEIGGAEAALAGLVDDRFAGKRRKLCDDLPAGLAAHQDAAARARIADAGTDLLRAPPLVGRQVGEIRPVALAGVDDLIMFGAHGGEHAADRLDRRA